MRDKSARTLKRSQRESRKFARKGRLLFFIGLAVVLAVAAVIGVLVWKFAIDHSPGLVIEDLKTGDGPEAVEGSAVSVDCTVWSENGTLLMDSSMGMPLVFTVGQGQVIEGLDRGVVGMRKGGRRQLTIPPNLGYGDQAFPDLPANSTITCEVVLLSVR